MRRRLTTFVVTSVVLSLFVGAIPAARADDPPLDDVWPATRQEIVSERTATTKVFREPDGTLTAEISAGPIHYTAGEAWEDIDTTLVPNTTPGFIWKNAADSFTAEFAPIARPLDTVRITAKGKTFTFGPVAPTPSVAQVSGSSITYPGIYPGVDLRYTVRNGALKEDLILHRTPVVPSVSFSIGGDVRAAANAEGGLGLVAGEQEVASIPRPFILESESPQGDRPPEARSLSFGLADAGAAQILSIDLDAAWVSDPARRFPLFLDPTMVISPPTKDTFVQKHYPNENYGASQDDLRVGSFEPGSVERSFVRFDISALAGHKVLNAELHLWEWWASSCNESWADVRRVTEEWTASTLTWNNQPAFGSTDYATVKAAKGWSAQGHGGPPTCDPQAWVIFKDASANTLADLVQKWTDGDWVNRGMAIVANDESNADSWKRFRAAEIANEGHRPKLEVNYTRGPNEPTNLSPASGVCSTDRTPALAGKYSDPDPDDGGYLYFDVEKSDGTAVTGSPQRGSFAEPGQTSSWTVSPQLPTGDTKYRWRAQANDHHLTSSWTPWQYYTYDATAPSTPTVTSSHAEGQWSRNNSPSFSYSSSDSPCGIDGYAYAFNQLQNTDPSTPFVTTTSKSYTGISDGTHWFHVRAMNNAGLWSAQTRHYQIKIDTTAPANANPVSASHVPNVPSNDPTIEMTWTPATDAHSGVAGYSWDFIRDSESPQRPDSPTEPATQTRAESEELSGDPETAYTFYLWSYDVAGNVSEETAGPYVINSDSTPPAGMQVTSPSHDDQESWYREQTAELDWTPGIDLESGIDCYGHRLLPWDGQSSLGEFDKVCDGQEQSATYSGRESGLHLFELRAKNRVGSWSDPVPYKIRVDIDAPVPPQNITSTHVRGTASSDPAVTMRWDAASDAHSGVAGYSWDFTNSEDDAGLDSFVTSTDQDRRAVEVLTDGTWWFHLATVDKAGNLSAQAHYGPIVIDSLVPNVPGLEKTVSPEQTRYAHGQAVTYTIHVTNPHGAAITVEGVTDELPSGIDASGARILTFAGSAANPSSGAAGAGSCADADIECEMTPSGLDVSSFSVPALASRSFTFDAVLAGPGAGCDAVTNAAEATSAAGSVTSANQIIVCESGLGFEPWWSTVSEDIGPASRAEVNVANGNLVVQQTDSTPVQGRGHVGYVLRRTYNSQDAAVRTLPGTLGTGWTLNVSEIGPQSDAMVANGLYVPELHSLAMPLAVTLVDRDGTRHVFSSRALDAPIEVSAPLAGPSEVLEPRVVSSDGLICIDQRFRAPRGVHLSLWRYVSTDASTCGDLTSANATVLGFAAESPDRVRYEFDATGRLLSVVDPAGVELRYEYVDGSGPESLLSGLKYVYEPALCHPGSDTTCRALRFSYAQDGTWVQVVDPAGRTTRYALSATNPARLMSVTTDGQQMFAFSYGSCDNAEPAQLCSITDPRGNATSIGYGDDAQGLPRVEVLTDRSGNDVGFSYTADPSGLPSSTTVDSGGRRRQFALIDASGRVGRLTEGSEGGSIKRDTRFAWDEPGAACRPDDGVDNNLCALTRISLDAATPDSRTLYLYNPEGKLLRQRRIGPGGSLYTTYGYTAQYVEANESSTLVHDTVSGGGDVSSDSRPADALFYVIDQTQQLSPRGNEEGASVAAYRTTYTRDADPSIAPNAALSSAGACTEDGQARANTGLVCQVAAPSLDAEGPSRTRFVYGAFGEVERRWSPRAVAEGLNPHTYTYYGAGDYDLSGSVRAAGWLKAVADPAGRFVAFAYDRAGNQVRTWDRNATRDQEIADFPGTIEAPANSKFTASLYSNRSASDPLAYAQPGRYVLQQRDQLVNTTTYTVDANGNAVLIRPPRGTDAGGDSFDIVQAFDDGDKLVTRRLPEDPSATAYSYDEHDNLVQERDPEGHFVANSYDEVNRVVSRRWSRGTASEVGSGACETLVTNEEPFKAGQVVCEIRFAYDGLDNLVAQTDADGAETRFAYDAFGREISRVAPREQETPAIEETRSDVRYDADGNPVLVCSAREFTEGDQTCDTDAPGDFSTVLARNAAGKITAITRTHDGGPRQTSYTYDANGNIRAVTDPAGDTTTWSYDDLDRKVSMTVPRTDTDPVTQWRYDPSGNVKALIEPGTDNGDLSGAASRITAYRYDDAHRLIETVVGADNIVAEDAGPAGASGGTNVRTRNFYDADGNLVGTLGPRAFGVSVDSPDTRFLERTEYDRNGRPIARYSPRASNDAIAEDPTQTQDCDAALPAPLAGGTNYPAGTSVCVTRYVYDGAGRVTEIRLPTSNGSDDRYLLYRWTNDGLLRSVNAASPESPGQRVDTASYRHDGAGRVVSQTDALGHASAYTYCADGLLAQIQGQDGDEEHLTSFGYDANGNRVRATDPEGNVSRITWHADDLVSSVEDGAGNKTRYRYTQDGHPERVFSPAANVSGLGDNNTADTPTVNTFTPDGLLETSTVPVASDGSLRRRTSYSYDLAGRKIAQHSDEVDASGNLVRAGRAQSFTYYPSGRLRSETGHGNTERTKTYSYDAAGNLTELVEQRFTGAIAQPNPNRITASWWLDDLVRSVSATQDSATSVYEYDGAGMLAARADTLCATCARTLSRYAYSDAGLASSMTGVLTGTTGFTYDAAGRLTGRQTGNGQELSYSYNDDDTLASLTATTATEAATWTYTYDAAYRISTQDYHGPSITGLAETQSPDEASYSYAYDQAGRISSFTDGQGTHAIDWDPNGNRIRYQSPTDGVHTFTYNADDSIATHAVDRAGTANDGQGTYVYDAAGRLDLDLCFDYSFDGFDRLTTALPRTDAPATRLALCGTGLEAANLSYDALDRTRSRQVGEVDVYDGLGPSLLRAGNGSHYALDPSGMPVGLKNGQIEQWLTGDGQGNVALVTGADASVACSVRYDPFGSFQSAVQDARCDIGTSAFNERFFRGAVLEQATGTYRFGARTYDPAKASFLTPDTFRAEGQHHDLSVGTDPLTRNTYAYVNGDPVNFVDPSGHRPVATKAAGANREQERFKDAVSLCARYLYMMASNTGVDEECGALIRSLKPKSSVGPKIARNVGGLATSIGVAVAGGLLCSTGIGCLLAIGVASGAAGGAVACPPGTPLWKCAALGGATGGLTAGAAAGGSALVRTILRRGAGGSAAGGSALLAGRASGGLGLADDVLRLGDDLADDFASTAAPRTAGLVDDVNVLPSSGKTFVATPQGTVYDVPAGWVGRTADSGRGIVYQRPGAVGNADMIRIMDPTAKYPSGYVRYYNQYGQPLDVYGKPASPGATHIPQDYQGPWPGWPS